MEGEPIALDQWDIIERELPTDYAQLAYDMGLIRARSPHLGAKIHDAADLLRLLLRHATGSSLESTTGFAGAAGLPDISAVALHKWERKAAPWLSCILSRMVPSSGPWLSFEQGTVGGYKVVVADGSTVMRPGAKGITARLHYAMRLPSLELVYCEATEVTAGETFRRYHVQRDELWIGDRGYGNPPGVAAICSKGAAVLVRINKTNLPLFTATGEQINLSAALAQVEERDVPTERDAFVHGPNGEVLQGRLCIVWLPEEQAQAARERTRKEGNKKDKKVTEDSLRTAEYVILFTTADRERIPLDLVFELYAARWQVELQIKRAKSIGHIDRLPNFRPDTIATWLYANLLMQQISRRLVDRDLAQPPFSPGGSPQLPRRSSRARSPSRLASPTTRGGSCSSPTPSP